MLDYSLSEVNLELMLNSCSLPLKNQSMHLYCSQISVSPFKHTLQFLPVISNSCPTTDTGTTPHLMIVMNSLTVNSLHPAAHIHRLSLATNNPYSATDGGRMTPLTRICEQLLFTDWPRGHPAIKQGLLVKSQFNLKYPRNHRMTA